MTDQNHNKGSSKAKQHQSTLQAKRYASERRFKYLGLGAVLVACSFLAVLLSTVVGSGIPAFTHYYLDTPLDFTDQVSADDIPGGEYDLVYKHGMYTLLPFMTGRKNKRIARNLLSGGAGIELREEVIADPDMLQNAKSAYLPMDDYADLYLKGLVASGEELNLTGNFSYAVKGKNITITGLEEYGFDPALQLLKRDLSLKIEQIERLISRKNQEYSVRTTSDASLKPDAPILQKITSDIEGLTKKLSAILAQQAELDIVEKLDRKTPSILISLSGGIVKINKLSREVANGKIIVPLTENASNTDVQIKLRYIASPEKSRKFSDVQAAILENLKSRGLIEKRWNTIFLTHGASREPEQAGVWGAITGSFFTMLVTLSLAFPLGISTAIYLEEFAPKNRLTDIIEVNINNLAAVPSIIFGLLGLAVFLNWFELPRSAPLVGGLVLALMTLPTIIIASRAAIKAVPPSIREAALGIGASKVQTVFHHVLPLAMPGMLTGTIIGMAQALGETAPLLMIGMVAFIVDIPGSLTDPATVMPVQIFMWADFPEPAFQQKTAAAILILLAFLVAMNAIAVLLRRRFERRW